MAHAGLIDVRSGNGNRIVFPDELLDLYEKWRLEGKLGLRN